VWFAHCFADGTNDRGIKRGCLNVVIKVIRRINSEPGVAILRRRWVVERA
jgi:hypothetical protein